MENITSLANATEIKPKPAVEERYEGLRVIVAIVRIVGTAIMVCSVIAILFAMIGINFDGTAAPGANSSGIIIDCVGCAVGGMLIYAFGALIQVLIDIEENTRRAAQ